MRPWAWTLAGSVAALAAVFACTGPGVAKRELGRADYPDLAALGADQLGKQKANLILAGTKIPVDVEEERDASRYKILVLAHDETLEEESYVVGESEFLFESLSGERFQPPIPIVRFPFKVGDGWDWTGEAYLGPNGRAATAKVTTNRDQLNLASGNLDTVQVSINLVVQTSKTVNADRKLQFWIKPKAGIVRREFGSSSLREPWAAEDGEQ
ncbi:MAG: hypothetical protein AB7F50_05940 [Fimbriimonadaceae bacterium]